MPRLRLAIIACAALMAATAWAGPPGGFRVKAVEPLRSLRPSFSLAEPRVADLGSRVDA